MKGTALQMNEKWGDSGKNFAKAEGLVRRAGWRNTFLGRIRHL